MALSLQQISDRIEIEAEIGKNGRSDPLPLAQEAEEQMLRPDGIVLEAARLLARKEDDLANALGKLVVHRLGCSSPALRSGFESGNVSHFQYFFDQLRPVDVAFFGVHLAPGRPLKMRRLAAEQ